MNNDLNIKMKRRSDPGTYEAIFELNKKNIFLKKEYNVLDVGCGAGSFLYEIRDLVTDRYGCDFNIDQYLEENNKKNIRRVDFDKEGLPYGENQFDTVFLLDVLEHVYNPISLLKESFRVVKSDGFVVVSTPNVHNFIQRIYFLFTGSLKGFWDEKDNRNNGERHITPIFFGTIKQLCVDNNFTIVSENYNRTIIPIIRINLKKKNRFLSETVVWVFQKK